MTLAELLGEPAAPIPDRLSEVDAIHVLSAFWLEVRDGTFFKSDPKTRDWVRTPLPVTDLAKLRPYLRHSPRCDTGAPCQCGLDEVLKSLESV